MADLRNFTAKYLREIFHYNPQTGIFKWRLTRGTAERGTIAGHINSKGYIANIKVNKKMIYLGHFKEKKQAITKYKKAAKKYFGEFARFK